VILAPLSIIICNILSPVALMLAILALVEVRRIEDPPAHIRVVAIVALVIASLAVLIMLGAAIYVLVRFLRAGTWP